jgi:DNA polymerase I-like protein with 3'-5' exonuclease and polymerase domains
MIPFDTSTLDPKTMHRLSPDTLSNVYNGLDCCLTWEIFEALSKELAEDDECVQRTYQFALDKSAPFLEMNLRGILIDQGALRKTQEELQKVLDGLKERFAFLTKRHFSRPSQVALLRIPRD